MILPSANTDQGGSGRANSHASGMQAVTHSQDTKESEGGGGGGAVGRPLLCESMEQEETGMGKSIYLIRMNLRAMQIVCSFMCKALPLQRRVNVHFQASQLQHEELLTGEPAPAPQPALLGQPESLPCLQVGACQGRPSLGYLLHGTYNNQLLVAAVRKQQSAATCCREETALSCYLLQLGNKSQLLSAAVL